MAAAEGTGSHALNMEIWVLCGEEDQHRAEPLLASKMSLSERDGGPHCRLDGEISLLLDMTEHERLALSTRSRANLARDPLEASVKLATAVIHVEAINTEGTHGERRRFSAPGWPTHHDHPGSHPCRSAGTGAGIAARCHVLRKHLREDASVRIQDVRLLQPGDLLVNVIFRGGLHLTDVVLPGHSIAGIWHRCSAWRGRLSGECEDGHALDLRGAPASVNTAKATTPTGPGDAPQGGSPSRLETGAQALTAPGGSSPVVRRARHARGLPGSEREGTWPPRGS